MYKNSLIAIAAIITLISLVSCSSVNTHTTITAAPNVTEASLEDNIIYASFTTDRIKIFSDYESLKDASAYIFSGTCISSDPLFQNDTLYTISKVKITQVFKGTLKAGDIVTIGEMGGRTTVGEYAKECDIEPKAFYTGPAAPDNQKVVVGTDGYFPMNRGDEVLLFVYDTTGFFSDISEPLYAIVGGYDGKLYLLGDGTYEKPDPSSNDKHEFSNTLKIALDQLIEIK